jgi:hypothetical protein
MRSLIIIHDLAAYSVHSALCFLPRTITVAALSDLQRNYRRSSGFRFDAMRSLSNAGNPMLQ